MKRSQTVDTAIRESWAKQPTLWQRITGKGFDYRAALLEIHNIVVL